MRSPLQSKITRISAGEARRLALAAQGYAAPRPAKVNRAHIGGVIRRLAVLQMDFVNVLVPAHYQVIFSRVGSYPRRLLDELARGPAFTEQWAHELSIIPVETWPLLRYRMEAHRPRSWSGAAFLAKHPEYLEWTLAQVRDRAPLTADDLAVPDGVERRLPGSWIGSIPRAALEALFGRGLLASVGRRSNFSRVYDLAERVLPPEHLHRRVEREEAWRTLLLQAARAHAVATAADLADYFRMSVAEARLRLAELVASGRLLQADVEGWREPAYLHPEARAPRRIDAAALLSPFDPLIWFRPRARRLFGFDYRVEIFFPAAQRRWGFYVLPFLLGDRLVARVDLKADRPNRRLQVISLHLEPHARKSVTGPLTRELKTLASWLDLEPAAPGSGKAPLIIARNNPKS
jgi:uncharacterized protein YcaQ